MGNPSLPSSITVSSRDYIYWMSRRPRSHRNASFPALLKTVFGLLKLPPLNLYDASAADLSDCFAAVPDYTPYRAATTDRRLFNPGK